MIQLIQKKLLNLKIIKKVNLIDCHKIMIVNKRIPIKKLLNIMKLFKKMVKQKRF
jgi:hypothetical protein